MRGSQATSFEVTDSLCLVILDLLMPEMNGWEFVEQLRQRARFAAVPIIVHSSAGPAPATVARVLKKPVAFDGLLAAVREYAARRNGISCRWVASPGR